MMASFVAGLMVPFHGLRLVFAHPELRRLALLPFIIGSLGAISALIALLLLWVVFLPTLLAEGKWYISWMPESLDFLTQILAGVTVMIAMSLGLVILFWLMIKLIMGPLLSRLTERTFDVLGERHPGSEQFFSMLGVAVLRTLIVGAVSVPFFLLLLVPGLGVFGALGLALLVASDILDFGLEARGLGLRRRWSAVRSQPGLISGMACGQVALSLVPGLVLALLPATVVGASALVVRLSREGKLR